MLLLLTAGTLTFAAGVLALYQKHYRQFAGWFGVAAIGQAAALQMIVAGPSAHYQHYPPLDALLATQRWSLAIILGQTMLVGGAIVKLVRSGTWRVTSTRTRLALALALSVCTAATVSPQVGTYLSELVLAAFLQILSLATIALMAHAAPEGLVGPLEAAMRRVFGDNVQEAFVPANRLGRFPFVLGLAATVIAALLSFFSYERHPHIPDEFGYIHHAKYLSAAMIAMPAPPVPAAFEIDLMEYEPARWYCPMPPGWPMVLAIGTLAGAPWLVNPVLTGVNVVLACWVLGLLYSKRIARLASMLLAVSPWFLFLGMSFMTHQLGLACVLLGALGVLQARRTGHPAWGLLAGAAVGLTSLIRPLDGMILGALVGLWAVGVGGTRLRLPALAGLAVGAMVVGGLNFPYNMALTGDPLRFPVNAYLEKHYPPNAYAYGFGPDRGLGWAIDPNPGHSPIDGLINMNLNAFGLNTDLFGWAAGSLVFVAWFLCGVEKRRQDWVMLGVVVAVVAAYFPFFFSGGPDFGARYWYPIIIPLVVLTVRGIQGIERKTGTRVWLAVGAMCAMTLATYLPWRAVDKYHNYRGQRAEIRQLADKFGFKGDLVLINGTRATDYASAFAQNPVDLTGPDTIYAWNRDAEVRAALLRAYPGRRVWYVDGPSVTNDGYRVTRGPETPAPSVREQE